MISVARRAIASRHGSGTRSWRRRIADAQARLDGHGRLVVRSSGTEPVIRVMGEGEDNVLVEEVVDGIVDALTSAA